MNLKLILIITGIIFLNALVTVVLFLFLRRKVEKKSKEKYKIDREVFYRRLNFIFFFFLLITGNWLIISHISPKDSQPEIADAGNIFKLNSVEDSVDKNAFVFPDEKFSNGLNLVFYADQYSNWEEFNADIDKLVEGIRKFNPWTEYTFLNIYRINPGIGEEICQIKTEDERKPTLRCGKNINQYLNQISAKNIRLVVLSRQEFQSWANLSRLESAGIFFSIKEPVKDQDQTSYAVLFAHLLGHTFGLKDEEKYVLAKADGAPHTPDGPNCAPNKETAEKWWGDLTKKNQEVGYFNACCGNESYIKPTESSIMNLNSGFEKFNMTYGPVSERYLKKVLDYCFSDDRRSYSEDQDFFDRYPEFKKCLR